MSRLDDMVLRLMRGLFTGGVFDAPPPTAPQTATAVVNTPQEKAIALEAAEGGAVLLKNAKRALPIRGAGKRIAVIGHAASPEGAQNFYQGGGSSKVPIAGANPNVVSPLEGITSRAEADGDVVTYADGRDLADAAATAAAADVAVVFVGDGASEGGDRSSLQAQDRTCTLFGCTPASPVSQDQIVAQVASVNPNTVVVLQTGAPVTMPWLSKVHGVLEMWYPGEQDGNAAAALLFGDVAPSGKLPYTFPKSLAQTPAHSPAQFPGVNGQSGYPRSVYSERLLVGYRWYDAKHLTPLFPFGFGLSYTRFRYGHLHVRPTSTGAVVRFTVTNIGRRTGAEVAQLYVFDPPSAHEPPKQLKGYSKVLLLPGESKTVTVRLGKRAFSYWDIRTQAWRVARGCFRIGVGGSSRSLPLRGSLTRRGGIC